ncbi:MAG: hypothetical protein J2P53_07415 [Bradyrhizobiaceae bacterium]|nr:hypothetical protein [Bradyrhizobiaceae bacterium]
MTDDASRTGGDARRDAWKAMTRYRWGSVVGPFIQATGGLVVLVDLAW